VSSWLRRSDRNTALRAYGIETLTLVPGYPDVIKATEGFEKSRRERKKIEMRFAHLKRILRLDRLRLRGPRGAQDEFVLAAIAQNLRRLAKLVARPPPYAIQCVA
jgi:hypothetical protein